MIQFLVIAILALLLFIAQVMLYRKYWIRGLEVDLNFQSTDMFEGDEGCLSEVIVNDKWLPLPMFNVKFQTDRSLAFKDSRMSEKTDQYYRNDVFRIGAHKRVTRILPFIAEKRGYYHINEVNLSATDMFMNTYFRASQEEDQYIYVYPKPFYSREFLRCLQMVNGQMQTKRQFLEDPFEYRGIREYQPYDDMKSINWKATAKTGDFKVNLHDFTAVKSVRIFLNLEDESYNKKTDCAEACIRIATGIIRFFAQKGMKVACYGNCKGTLTDNVLVQDAGSSLQEIYRTLAKIDLSKEVVNFEKYYANRILSSNSGEYTFIISLNAYDDFVAFLQKYCLVSGDFLWFYPYDRSLDVEIPARLQSYFRPINISRIS